MSNKAERLLYLFLFQHSSPRAGLGSHSLHPVLKFRGIRKVELVWAQQNHRRLEKRTWIFSQLPCSFTGLQNQFQLQHHLYNSLVFRWCSVLHPQGQGEVCSHRDEGKASDRQEAKVKHIPGELMVQVLTLEFSGWCSSLESCSSALILYLMWIQCWISRSWHVLVIMVL